MESGTQNFPHRNPGKGITYDFNYDLVVNIVLMMRFIVITWHAVLYIIFLWI